MSGAPGREALAALLARPGLARLLGELDGKGEEARVVGGAVRNSLLGRPVHEVDLATTATPDEVDRRARAAGFKVAPTGIEHGTVTVVVGGEPFEVTTLREDVETDGRRAKVRFGRDFEADALRRDFTINALSLSRDGRVHDPVGGMADLAARRVRFVGDPAVRIREDYLRILRFFRFHAEYGEGEPDPAGLAAAIRGRAGLALLSRERVRAELMKLLAGRRAGEVAGVMSDTGLFALILGGVGETGRLARVAAQEARERPDAVRRLGALAILSQEDADRLRDKLRLSNEEHGRLSAYARALARAMSWAVPADPAAVRRLAVEHGLEALADVSIVTDGEPRPMLTPDARETLRRLMVGAEDLPVFPLRGADFLGRGVPKGPRVGELLARARASWLASGCPTGAAVAPRLIEAALAEDAG